MLCLARTFAWLLVRACLSASRDLWGQGQTVTHDCLLCLLDRLLVPRAKSTANQPPSVIMAGAQQQILFREAPITAASPICVDSRHPVVLATASLGWRPTTAAADGAAMVELWWGEWMAAFGTALHSGPAPPDRAASNAMSILRLRLTEARIITWMTTLGNSNAFAAGQQYKTKKSVHRAIRNAGFAAADTEVEMCWHPRRNGP